MKDFIVCSLEAPALTLATYTFGMFIAIWNKSFLGFSFPVLENSATAPTLVDFDVWPPVFEYTSVSNTKTFIFSFVLNTWSNPPNPISYAHPSPPTIHTFLEGI